MKKLLTVIVILLLSFSANAQYYGHYHQYRSGRVDNTYTIGKKITDDHIVNQEIALENTELTYINRLIMMRNLSRSRYVKTKSSKYKRELKTYEKEIERFEEYYNVHVYSHSTPLPYDKYPKPTKEQIKNKK